MMAAVRSGKPRGLRASGRWFWSVDMMAIRHARGIAYRYHARNQPESAPGLRKALTAFGEHGGMKRFFYPAAIVVLAVTAAFADPLPSQIRAEASRLLVQVNAARDAALAKPILKPVQLS